MIKQDTTYNGWTNYATWRINLEWFDASDCLAEYTTAEEFEAHVTDFIEDTTDSIVKDYALAFIADVNWHEIAEHYTTEGEEDE